MLTRDKVNFQIESKPNEFTQVALIVEKIEIGLAQIKCGKTISEEELNKRMELW